MFNCLIYKYIAYQAQIDVKHVISLQNYQKIETINEVDKAKIDQMKQDIINYDFQSAEAAS